MNTCKLCGKEITRRATHCGSCHSRLRYPAMQNILNAHRIAKLKEQVTNTKDVMIDGKPAKEIPLTQGKVALVDAEDYELVKKYKWRAAKGHNTWYVFSDYRRPDGKWRTLRMHRVVMNAKRGQLVDHEDHNGLDNRRSKNLRFATHSQNMQNQRSHKNSSSKYKGVGWNKYHNCWQTHIQADGKQQSLGYFNTEHEAALAYNDAARKLHGKFANLNIVSV